MTKHPFTHFMPVMALTAILLTSPSPKAALQGEEELEGRQPARTLIQTITNALHWPDESSNAQELKQKVRDLQQFLDDGALDRLMILGSQYMQSITLPAPQEAEESVQPQINELLTVLDLLADMERDHPDQRGTVSHFAYSTLEHYFPSASFVDQQFYLNLFHGLFVDANFDEELTRLIINWSVDFMRSTHTDDECTQIAHLVRDFIFDNPEEHYETSLLQVAYQEEESWEDKDVIPELESLIGRPQEEQEDNSSEGSLEDPNLEALSLD
jgi:hypothetical protein